mgnify:CR=1 FL=1
MNKGNTIPVNTDINVTTCIFNYIKDVDNNKRGLMVAVNIGEDDPDVYIGWSLCHSDDNYNQQHAFDLALFRAYASKMVGDVYKGKEFMKPMYIPEFLDIPNSIECDMLKFLDRTNRYFKIKGEHPFQFLEKEFEQIFPIRGGLIEQMFSPAVYGNLLSSVFGVLDEDPDKFSFKLNI